MWFILFLGIAIGIFIGRVYAWMKYSYPESQEMIHLKVAKTRAERARYEAETERLRQKENEILEKRISG